MNFPLVIPVACCMCAFYTWHVARNCYFYFFFWKDSWTFLLWSILCVLLVPLIIGIYIVCFTCALNNWHVARNYYFNFIWKITDELSSCDPCYVFFSFYTFVFFFFFILNQINHNSVIYFHSFYYLFILI